jgi:inner membrane protein
MDSLSHALVGVAVAGLSGHQPALGDPIYIAAVLGAQAPDFDIVAQARGSMAYLRQHRGFSHSIPGVALFAAAIAAGIKLAIPQADIVQALLWAFAGGLSHALLDYFNSHGAAILWPLRRERKSFPLLNVFDPVVIVLLLAAYATGLPMQQVSYVSFAALTLYIFARYCLKRQAARWLTRRYAGELATRIWVMPCLKRLFYWDFVVETDRRYVNGRLGAFYPLLDIKADLPRQELSPLAEQASRTALGEFFTAFTPFIYFEEQADEDAGKVKIYDLRYHSGDRFVHSATITFTADMTLRDAYMHSLGQTVKVTDGR